ncbi:hypothetical protein BJX70DRAFT_155783 [Aspergillus crustosus]
MLLLLCLCHVQGVKLPSLPSNRTPEASPFINRMCHICLLDPRLQITPTQRLYLNVRRGRDHSMHRSYVASTYFPSTKSYLAKPS